MRGPLYFAPGVSVTDGPNAPEFARIRNTFSLAYRMGPGGEGCVAYPEAIEGGVDTVRSLLGSELKRECQDGLIYYPPQDIAAIKPGDVALPGSEHPMATKVTTSAGVELRIMPSLMAPRAVLFDSPAEPLGDEVSEYGVCAREVRNDLVLGKKTDGSAWDPLDERALRLVYLAVANSYAVTTEMLSDLGWVTQYDLLTIIIASQDFDPLGKAKQAEDSAPAP